MPRKSPYTIELSAEQRKLLEAQVRRYTLPYRVVIRAKIVLLAAAGLGNDEIAARLDTRREIVSKWRKRFFEEGMGGLEERARAGRPPVFPPEVAIDVKAIACELPARDARKHRRDEPDEHNTPAPTNWRPKLTTRREQTPPCERERRTPSQ